MTPLGATSARPAIPVGWRMAAAVVWVTSAAVHNEQRYIRRPRPVGEDGHSRKTAKVRARGLPTPLFLLCSLFLLLLLFLPFLPFLL